MRLEREVRTLGMERLAPDIPAVLLTGIGAPSNSGRNAPLMV